MESLYRQIGPAKLRQSLMQQTRVRFLAQHGKGWRTYVAWWLLRSSLMRQATEAASREALAEFG
jgi:hypothetical protein